MKIEKIKPIPKYIQKKIKLYDDQLKSAPFGRTRFYAYFTKNDGELVKVTVAVREYKKQWYCKPVVVHGVHSDRCFGKDIKFTFIAGYSVGWHEQGLSKYPDWYESNDWGWSSDDSFDPYAPIVNRDYILQHFPEYKYSAVDRYTGIHVFKYLRLYEQYPQIEYLTKLGLHNIAMSTQILRLCGKDKKFRKWLAKNRQDIVLSNYYVSSIMKAYKTGKPIREINNFAKRKIKFDHADKMDTGFYLMILNILVTNYPKEFNVLKELALNGGKYISNFVDDNALLHLLGYGLIENVDGIYKIRFKTIERYLLGKYKYERTNLTIEEQKQEIQYRINSVEMSLRKLVKNTLATLKGINKAKELVLKVMTEHTAIQSYDLTKANSLS